MSSEPDSPRHSPPTVAGVAASPRLSSLRFPTPGTRHSARGFSLVELMIAIMILGLGMVMAATVFPVSLDMTRGTVQLNISETTADTAVAILALRVPRQKNLDDNPALNVPRLALPDAVARELTGAPLAHLDSDELPVSDPQVYVDQTGVRVYTEQTFWDAQGGPVSGNLPAYVVDSQNLQLVNNQLRVIPERPPVVTGVPSALPRISVVDRVYPPVDLVRDGVGNILPIPTLALVAERRYSWTAIHFRDITDEAQKSFFCRIVVFYRGNPNARYARQDGTTAGTDTPLPVFDVRTETLFPQAWLVTLTNPSGSGPVISGTGLVTCTPQVASMLPAGSYLVLAQGGGAGLPGTYAKILKNTWDGRYNTTLLPTLQIRPGDLLAIVDSSAAVPVWVFPPAISSRDPNNFRFETTSPVVDVVPKKVVAG